MNIPDGVAALTARSSYESTILVHTHTFNRIPALVHKKNWSRDELDYLNYSRKVRLAVNL